MPKINFFLFFKKIFFNLFMLYFKGIFWRILFIFETDTNLNLKIHKMIKIDDIPNTQGIKYTGSKLKLLPDILKLSKITGAKTVLDGFSGTTRVSQAYAKSGYNVIANDVSIYSQVFGRCFLKSQKTFDDYKSLIEHLNNTPPVDGWFTENYGGDEKNPIGLDGLKKPWQRHNTKKLDGIRLEIDKLNLDENDKSVALTALILAMDKVDSTIGHYAAYLSKWSDRSYSPILLTVPDTSGASNKHKVICDDVFSTLENMDYDLAYYDPPYGSNNDKMPASRVRYAAYYHIWKSICLFDKSPLFGKAMRRKDSSDKIESSPFEDFRKDENGRFIAANSLDNLIKNTKSDWIILSYSSGGRAVNELREIVSSHGKIYEEITVNYKKNVMAGMTWTDKWTSDDIGAHCEYLFLLKK